MGQIIAKGTDLFRPGDKPDFLYRLDKGYVRNYVISDSGLELTLNIIGPNRFIPLISFYSSWPQQFFTQTLTECEVTKIPKTSEHTDETLKDAAEKFSKATHLLIERMQDLVFLSAKERVLRSLQYILKATQSSTVPFPLTHEDIAALAGINRETASRIISQLSKAGQLSVNKQIYSLPTAKS